MRITAAGLKESHPHDVTMTVEAPNYVVPLTCGPVRDLVEIGMGREARRSYDLEQVEIVPSRRTRSSQEVSTAWQLDAYPFAIPLVTHPSDAVVSPASAVRIGQLGGLAVLNAEGLWARHADADGALARVVGGRGRTTRARPWRLLQELHAVPIDAALLTEALKRVREAGVTVAARVSPQRARELDARPARRRASRCSSCRARSSPPSTCRAASRSTSRTSSPRSTCPVVAGGCGDYRTAMHLMRTGAAGVIVGYGQSVGHHHRRGPRHRGAHGHRDRRRRRRPPRLPRRDRRPLRPRHRRRRHPQLRRRRQGHRLRRGRRDARRAARRRLRRPRLRRLLDVGGGAPVAAALGGRAGARRVRATWSACSSARRAAPSARSTSSARCGGRWRRPATRT